MGMQRAVTGQRRRVDVDNVITGWSGHTATMILMVAAAVMAGNSPRARLQLRVMHVADLAPMSLIATPKK